MIDAASRPCRPHRGVLCPIERLPWPRRWREGACGSPARRWTDPVALRLPRGCRRGLVSQVQRAPTWVGGTLPPRRSGSSASSRMAVRLPRRLAAHATRSSRVPQVALRSLRLACRRCRDTQAAPRLGATRRVRSGQLRPSTASSLHGLRARTASALRLSARRHRVLAVAAFSRASVPSAALSPPPSRPPRSPPSPPPPPARPRRRAADLAAHRHRARPRLRHHHPRHNRPRHRPARVSSPLVCPCARSAMAPAGSWAEVCLPLPLAHRIDAALGARSLLAAADQACPRGLCREPDGSARSDRLFSDWTILDTKGMCC